ncbi:MAG: copper chaperone PCu(A)C [Oceanicaulis sp.]
MTRFALFAAASVLALAACEEREEPGALTSELEEDGATPGDAVDVSEPADGMGDTMDRDDASSDMSGDTMSGDTGMQAGMSDPQITSGWVRNPPGGRDVTAGFLTMEGGPARLVAVETREAERVELHTMEMDGDVMRMRQVEGFDVPGTGALELATGGDHLMIFGLSPEAASDGELELVFTFEDGRTLETALPFADSAPVTDAGGSMTDGDDAMTDPTENPGG